MMTKIIFKVSIIISKTTVSASESCFISIASTCVLVTTIAAWFLLSPDVKILNFLVFQQFCFGLYMVPECKVFQGCPQLFSIGWRLQPWSAAY